MNEGNRTKEIYREDFKKYRKMFLSIRAMADKTKLSTRTIQNVEISDKKVSLKTLLSYFVELQELLIENDICDNCQLFISTEFFDELKLIFGDSFIYSTNTIEMNNKCDNNLQQSVV